MIFKQLNSLKFYLLTWTDIAVHGEVVEFLAFQTPSAAVSYVLMMQLYNRRITSTDN
jgi:hypothetical protein